VTCVPGRCACDYRLDDTDSKEGGRHSLLHLHSCRMSPGSKVSAISHHVAMLNPDVYVKTAGTPPALSSGCFSGKVCDLEEKTLRFVAGESLSRNGDRDPPGLTIPAGLREYGRLVRKEIVTVRLQKQPGKVRRHTAWSNGVIGAWELSPWPGSRTRCCSTRSGIFHKTDT